MQDNSKSDPRNGAPTFHIQLHGVLVRVLDTGVLLLGESGIGKSECALDLVTKGHQLIADDVVDVDVTGEELIGKAPALTFELLEIRGLGIINVRELFGTAAVRSESPIELCVELQKWLDVERIENVLGEHDIAGCHLPKFVLPVSSGRNLSTLVETAARLYNSRDIASNAAEILMEKQAAMLNPIR